MQAVAKNPPKASAQSLGRQLAFELRLGSGPCNLIDAFEGITYEAV